jgi:hypothetical protein
MGIARVWRGKGMEANELAAIMVAGPSAWSFSQRLGSESRPLGFGHLSWQFSTIPNEETLVTASENDLGLLRL